MQKFHSESLLLTNTLISLKTSTFLLSMFLLSFSIVCPAAVINVPENYSTIQEAIDAASDGDEIIVSSGTYYENINFLGKSIILRSTDPTNASVVASTIIDGSQAASVVTFSGTENETCILFGFTITNGRSISGGGIEGNATLATIKNNIISSNTAYIHYGGGIYRCDGTIRNNIISNNFADENGGGLSFCNGTILNNNIHDNYADYWGGGITWCGGTVLNNTIYGNSARKYGGGVLLCGGLIINCIVWENSAPEDSQVHGSSAFLSYSCIQGWTGGGIGNISSDPKFVDPSNRNFCLQPDSPCIDAGNKFYLLGKYIADMDGECRIAGSSVDMGSDEYGSSADSDGDLLADGDEASLGSDPSNPDTDRDGLRDGVEVLRGTDPTVGNLPSGISIPADYLSIQEGLFWAFPLEVVTVSLGTYNENIHLLGKDVTLQSIDPFNDDIITRTVIDGGGLFSAILCAGMESEFCVVKGLTIRNGSSYQGGGIKGNNSKATIENNRILDNSAIWYGAGFYECDGIIQNNVISGNSAILSCCSGGDGGGLQRCDGTIQNNVISGNSAYYGGGLRYCNGTIQNNTISSNSAGGNGGGVCDSNGTIQDNMILGNSADGGGGGLFRCCGTIQNNTISGNSAGRGGGLSACNGIIQNNIISGNSAVPRSSFSAGLSESNKYQIIPRPTPTPTPIPAAYGGGLSGCNGTIQNNTIYANNAGGQGKGGGLNQCRGVIRNCIVWKNYAATDAQLYGCSIPSYSCIQNWTEGGTGNISAVPQLVAPNWDFHLQLSSPCIDAGGTVTLSQDFEGDPRPWNGTSEPRGDGSDFDIGADEYIGPISFDFTSWQEGWTTGSAPVAFSVPQYIYRQGCVTIVSQNNTNTFGFWGSPDNAILVTEGYIYRARFVVSTDVPDPSLVPQIRLRVNARNLQQADYLTIESSGDGGASPGAAGTTYDLYFVPPANAGYCMLAFDLLNFNPSDAAYAELALESVIVERFRLDTLDESTTITWTYDFETSQEFWTTSEGIAVFTDPEFFWADGALHLQSTTNTSTFGYWGSDPADITIEEGRLYRGTFEVRTDEPDRSRVPQMRLRFNTANMQASRSFEVTSAGDGANSPGITNTTYDRLYFLPPANCVGEGLLVSFDIFNFLPDEAAAEASLILDRAIIETLSLPDLP